MLLTLTPTNDITVSIVTNALQIGKCRWWLKKKKQKNKADKISDRNQASHSVSGNAERTCLMGRQRRGEQ